MATFADILARASRPVLSGPELQWPTPIANDDGIGRGIAVAYLACEVRRARDAGDSEARRAALHSLFYTLAAIVPPPTVPEPEALDYATLPNSFNIPGQNPLF